MEEIQEESLPNGTAFYVSAQHPVQTDGILLAQFARVNKHMRVCDLCSGCGIIPLFWLDSPDAPSKSYALELLESGVRLMRRTCERNPALADRFFPMQGDLRALPEYLAAGGFDVVSCNPPYTRQGAGRVPSGARQTARHERDCSLEDVCNAAGRLLRHGGRFYICQRPQRMADVFSAMRAHGIEPKRMQLVQGARGRAPFLFLLEGVRGGKSTLEVLPVAYTG